MLADRVRSRSPQSGTDTEGKRAAQLGGEEDGERFRLSETSVREHQGELFPLGRTDRHQHRADPQRRETHGPHGAEHDPPPERSDC